MKAGRRAELKTARSADATRDADAHREHQSQAGRRRHDARRSSWSLSLSAYHLATLARLSLEETASRGEMLAQAIFQRARDVVAQGGADPLRGAARRRRLRSMLESSVVLARTSPTPRSSIADGVAVAHSFPSRRGAADAPQQEDLAPLGDGRSASSSSASSYRGPHARDPRSRCCSRRRGVRLDSHRRVDAARPQRAGRSASDRRRHRGASRCSSRRWSRCCSRSGCCGRSTSSRAASARLGTRRARRHARSARSRSSATWAARSTPSARSCSAAQRGSERGRRARRARPTSSRSMDNLEDAVALFSPRGELIFCNTAMSRLLASAPVGRLGQRAAVRSSGAAAGRARARRGRSRDRPAKSACRPHGAVDGASGAERLLMTHAIED